MKGRIAGAAAAVTLLIWPPAALAHVCFVAKKPAGAGSAGTATLDVTNGELTPGADLRVNPAGNLQGGFITITAVAGGTTLGTADTFSHTTLPDSARNAGPGDDMCDGVGIDDAEACTGG